MPEGEAEGALGVIRNPERTIGSVIESIKSPQRKNSVEANSLFIAKETLDVQGYEQEGGGFNEGLLRARAEQTLLPDGSRPTVEMIRDWFEAKKELADAILNGKVDAGRPITQQNKEEAAYHKALNITRQREGADTAEPHITDPEENKKIFEKAAAELEEAKVKDLTLVVENWEDLVKERAHQLSEVREGKQTQAQDLNDFLKERAGKEETVTTRPEKKSQPLVGPEEPSEGGPQPPGEGEAPAEPTEEAAPAGQPPLQEADARQRLERIQEAMRSTRRQGLIPTPEQEAEVKRLQQQLGLTPEEKGAEAEAEAPEKEAEEGQEEEEKQPGAEGKEEAKEPQEPEEKKEEKKQGFVGKVGGFIKNWWKSVSPQGRNKLYWGLGVGVGAVETVAGRGFLVSLGLGPAASWAISGVNALVLNGFNYRVQKGITEAKANQDLEKIQKLEAQYKKAADFFAGVAAGSVGAAVGDALWNGLVAPKLPQIQEGIQGLGKRFGIGAEATSPPIMGETASPPAPTPETTPASPPPETPRPIDELFPPAGAETVVPAEATKYVVAPGDTLTEILDKNGYKPYGKSLTEIIVKNADVLRERALNDAQRQAIDQLVANPNWTAIDDKEKWKIIMRAGHWIFPGQELILPVKP